MTIDIGDSVPLTLTITHPVTAALVDPATVDVAVTRPDGTAAAPEVILNPSTGVYTTAVAADAAGTWSVVWSTTDPGNVEHHQFIVQPSPPDRLSPLAGISDVEALLGRALGATEAAMAPGLLHSASVRVRAYCHQRFNMVADDSIVIRPVGTRLTLPHTPVVEVSTVTAIGGNSSIADVAVTGWTFDGLDQIDVRGGLNPNTWVSLPAILTDVDRSTVSYRVVYSHGWPVVPDLVVDVVAGAALRCLVSPGDSDGITQVTIGQYSEQHQQSTGSAGRRPYLTRDDKELLMAEGLVRGTQGTIQLHAY